MALVRSNADGGYFNGYIRQRINDNKNFIAAVTGPTGSGKSYSVLKEGEALDPDFDVDNVCFNGTQFMDLVNGKTKKLKRGSNIMFDEMQITLGHLDYQSVQSKLLNYVLQTFRHRNFVLWVTTPQFSFINASARKLFHCRMETKSIDKQRKLVILRPLLLQINQRKGDVYEKFLRVVTDDSGVVPLESLKVGLASKKLIQDYEDKKAEFTTNLNRSIAEDLKKIDAPKEKPKKLTILQEEILNDLVDGCTVKDIAQKKNISINTVYGHMEALRKKGVDIKAKRENNHVIGYKINDFSKEFGVVNT